MRSTTCKDVLDGLPKSRVKLSQGPGWLSQAPNSTEDSCEGNHKTTPDGHCSNNNYIIYTIVVAVSGSCHEKNITSIRNPLLSKRQFPSDTELYSSKPIEAQAERELVPTFIFENEEHFRPRWHAKASGRPRRR